ncbi:8562_t:CDS:10 [Diversispora eburnea]|uniref:8562_t:CDS:1 n=1 Tax=Diversispora eburnea TaxID=1213867 RepID=A0A9N8VE31_9GLOM|nr:8562_t:CDS:10 [Diversispora eburnea]
MLYGYPPFISKSRHTTRMKIINWRTNLKFPSRPKVSREAQDLIGKLICEKEDRLGSSKSSNRPNELYLSSRKSAIFGFDDASEIKSHPWFKDIDWDNLHKSKPPFIPQLKNDIDTRYFEENIDDKPLASPENNGHGVERKPKDPMLRDKHHGKEILDMRKALAFIGYTFKGLPTENQRGSMAERVRGIPDFNKNIDGKGSLKLRAMMSFEKQVSQLNINEDVGPRIAERTSYGKQGHVVKLRSNYFKVSKFPNVIVSHYSFESTPKSNKATIAQIYYQVAEDNRFKIYHAVYDVGTYEATIRFVQRLNFIELKKHIFGGNASMSEVLTSLAALNTYINFSARQKYLAIGKGVYPVDTRGKPTILPGGLELKQGFYQSLRPGTGGNVLDIACKVLGKKSKDEFRRVIHRGQKKTVYRVRGITTESADRLLFSFNKEKRKITVAEYFYCTYGRKLEFETLPCIIVNKEVLMPMEVCQRFSGALADTTLADMIRYTCIKPKERFNQISFSTKEIFQYDKDSLLKSIGMDVESQNMLVNALEYHQKSSNARFVPESGRWNITNKMVTQGKTLQNWSVIAFSTERANQKPVIKRFIQQFREVASQKGMNVFNDPEIYYANPSGDIQKSLYQACCLARRFNKALPPQIVFCILEQTGPLYGEIKRIGDTIMGVPTQIILAKLLTKRGVDQICSNLALKVNVKLGGQNCFLANGQLDFVSEAPTMIFGADVFHAGRGENQPSVAAVCASMDIKATEYCGRYSKNKEPRNETIENLQEMTGNLLHAFYIKNNTLPDRILFYRDGVSEGQFEHVLRIEVKALKAVFESIYRKGFEPKLTFVVVQKRHHTRFMPNESRDGDKNGNCRPGTVVDSTIVVSQEFDFLYYAHLMANRARYYLQWGDSKSDGSNNSSCSISNVKSELMNTMYFTSRQVLIQFRK